MSTLPRGLYAITPDWENSTRLLMAAAAALDGGAAVMQYRNKLAPPVLRELQARRLLSLCHAAGVPLIINDDLDLALRIDADGVHLGGDDGDLAAARKALGSEKILGASCYNEAKRAKAAIKAGADYIAFGAAYPSPTKPAAPLAKLELYRKAVAQGQTVVAIGGITAENAPQLIEAGVNNVAVISALFDTQDVVGNARLFSRLYGVEDASTKPLSQDDLELFIPHYADLSKMADAPQTVMSSSDPDLF